MLTPTIIVAEQGELWLAVLRTCVRRSAASRLEPAWQHVTDREEVAMAVARAVAPFVVVEVTWRSAARDLLDLGQWRAAFPAACFVAALSSHPETPRVRELRAGLREAGAAHVLTSPRRAAEIVPLLERHSSRIDALGGTGSTDTSGLGAVRSEILSALPACWTAKNGE